MLNNLKALVVVGTLAFLVFRLARPICLRFMEPQDYDRRVKVWMVLTIVTFASPTFYTFALLSIPILVWAARRDSNPAALYLMLFYVAPNVQFAPIHQLFAIGHVRLLGFCILIPALMRTDLRQIRGEPNWKAMSFYIVAFCLLQVALFAPLESLTACVRRGFLLLLDLAIPFVAFSRILNSRKSIAEAMCALVLATAVMAPVGFFESMRNWLLYVGVGNGWGAPQDFAFLLRAGKLRAQVSAGHSIAFGYAMAVGFGLWLYLQRGQLPKSRAHLVTAWLWMGSFAAYSRAPWLVAVIMMFAYLLMLPHGFSRSMRALMIMGMLFGAVAMTPLGASIIDTLPFVGTLDSQNVTYRQTLFQTSVELIKEKPWFGDRFVMLRMEHLRQGQGIIDLVNGYLYVALFFGLTGLWLLGSFLIGCTFKAYAACVKARQLDTEFAAIGACVGSIMFGTMIYIATAGFELLTWAFAGMAVAYARVVSADLRERARVKQPRRLVPNLS
jgi:hypothetical protein